MPKLLLVADDTAGAAKLAWLSVLNTSKRNCAYMPLGKWKSFRMGFACNQPVPGVYVTRLSCEPFFRINGLISPKVRSVHQQSQDLGSVKLEMIGGLEFHRLGLRRNRYERCWDESSADSVRSARPCARDQHSFPSEEAILEGSAVDTGDSLI